jgi:hypothetical protein
VFSIPDVLLLRALLPIPVFKLAVLFAKASCPTPTQL